MAMNFPDSPSVGDRYTVDNQTWEWTGTTWDSVTETSQLTGGTAGYTALSNGTAGLSYQPVSPNYIINGAFDINQRGFTTTTAEEYIFDRWKTNPFGGSVTYEAKTFTPGELSTQVIGDATNYLRITSTGGNVNQARLEHYVEDVRTLAGQSATLSFYAKMNSSNTYRVQVIQSFGSGGSGAVIVESVNVSIGTTWERHEINFTMDSVSGKTIGDGSSTYLRFYNPDNESFTLDLWGVQLEAGSIATPFKRNANSIQGELAACQRYYYRFGGGAGVPLGSGVGHTSSSGFALVKLPVPMRANSTGSIVAQGFRFAGDNSVTRSVTVDSAFVNSLQNDAAQINVSGSFTQGYAYQFNGNGGLVEFSAEL